MITQDQKVIPVGLTRESVVITELRGPMTGQIRKAVLREEGESGWKALLAKVSEPCRRTFSKPLGMYEWIPAEHSKELSLAYLAGRDPSYTYRRGIEAATEQITVVNQWMLKLMSPSLLLQNMPRFFDFYYRGGRVVVDHLGPGTALLSLWADAFYQEWYEHGLRGWFEAALGLTGAKHVTVKYHSPDGEGLLAFRHVYEVHWDP